MKPAFPSKSDADINAASITFLSLICLIPVSPFLYRKTTVFPDGSEDLILRIGIMFD
jgi:hypothetical protein